MFKDSSVFRYFSVTPTNLSLVSKNINPENFLWKAKQEFPCQSLESFSEEYYNMENKVLDFQFGPVCTNQTCPNYSVGSEQDEAEKSSMTDGIHQNGATVKNVKRYQPVKNACVVKKFRQLMHFI